MVLHKVIADKNGGKIVELYAEEVENVVFMVQVRD